MHSVDQQPTAGGKGIIIYALLPVAWPKSNLLAIIRFRNE